MRLDKFLADAGIGTRSEAKNIIKKGLVSVNENLVKDPGFAVTEQDRILCRDIPVAAKRPLYFMMHKPAGCVCATKDADQTVLDYIGPEDRRDLFPVGRLDKDTEGLLLLTDDGMFAHNLTSPRKHVKKTYYFEGDGVLCEDAVDRIAAGINIGDEKPTLPATLHIEKTDKTLQKVSGTLTICEGRYHQVKRMLYAMGVTVVYLKRLSIGEIHLDPSLAKGQYRPLTEEEITQLSKERKHT